MGRLRKPVEVHIRNGNPSHYPLPEPLPVPKGCPTPPAHYDKEHLEIWNFYVDAIDGMGVMSPNDAHAIEMMVDSWVAYRYMQRLVLAEGYTSDTKAGLRVSPECKVREMMFKNTMQMLTQFGFTPVARANIVVSESKKDEGNLTKLLASRQNRKPKEEELN